MGGGLGVYGANAGPNRLRQQPDGGQILGRQLGLYAAGMWQRITNSDMLSRFVTASGRLPPGLIFPDERATLTKPA